MFALFFHPVQCADNARGEVQEKLRGDDPSTVWLTLDGWSAETTSYIGVEICMFEIQTHFASDFALFSLHC